MHDVGRQHAELLRAEQLTKIFSGRGGDVVAVDNVDLSIKSGETVGVVGESGSGKSTLARLVLRLVEPTSGHIYYKGEDFQSLSGDQLRKRRLEMQMVFQNPFGSLLPNLTVADNVAEPLRIHRIGDKEVRRDTALELLATVGVNPQNADLYPRQFSGGQQQRVAIARALTLKPSLLICDEPTSALDASIQAQILTLFERLQAELGFAILFITHNLAVVDHLADRILVMNRGRVVESAPTRSLFETPRHPYTRTLLAAVLPVRGVLPPPVPPDLDTSPRGTTMMEIAPDHYVLVDQHAARA
jgi:peptide/nickel transport system ATP-binding protein